MRKTSGGLALRVRANPKRLDRVGDSSHRYEPGELDSVNPRSKRKKEYTTMKTRNTISWLALASALVLAAGCGKTETAAPPAATTTPAPTSEAATEARTAAEAARKAELDKAVEMAKAAEAQLTEEAEKVALAAKEAEALRVAEAEKAAAKLAEAERTVTQAAADAKVAAQQLQADVEQVATTKAAEANTATASLAQQAFSVLQQPGQVEKLIASAKNLTGQNKYAEALKIVAELAKLKLSPEQQAMVDQLKQVAEQQMAKAMAAKAAGAAVQATDIPCMPDLVATGEMLPEPGIQPSMGVAQQSDPRHAAK